MEIMKKEAKALKEGLSILYSSSNLYAPYAGVSLVSLLENNHKIVQKIFYLDGGLEGNNKEKLYDISEKYQVNIEIISTKPIEKYLKENGVPKYKGSYATFCKLFVLDFIECQTTKLLYLDADTIIDGELQGIIDFDFHNCPVAMVYEALTLRHKKKIGMKGKKYFNGGVVLFNVDKWREEGREKAIHHIQNNHAIYASAEQDILNVVFEGEIALLPIRYNYTTLNVQFTYDNLCKIFQLNEKFYYSKAEALKDKDNVAIYHGLGYFGVQTWHAEETHPFNDIWNNYLSKSPWRDYTKEKAQLTIINKGQRVLYTILPHFIYNPLHRIAVDFSLYQTEKRNNKLMSKK